MEELLVTSVLIIILTIFAVMDAGIYEGSVNDFNEKYTWLDKKSKDYDKNKK